MLRWYWYLCGAAHVRETALLGHHQPEDYERWPTTPSAPEGPQAADRSVANTAKEASPNS
jgi:hypothetical protein